MKKDKEVLSNEEINTLKDALEIARKLKNKGGSKIGLGALAVTSSLGKLIEKIEDGAE